MLIADDHPLFREGLRALLGALPELDVVGEAATGEEAVAAAAALRPDVVLMDLQMPGISGIEATRAIVRRRPARARAGADAVRGRGLGLRSRCAAGARGYVLKDADEEELLGAIRAVARGEAIFSPAVAARVLAFFAARRAGAHGVPRADRARARDPRPDRRRGTPTRRSPGAVAEPEDGAATTSRRSSPSCRWPTAPRRSSAPARPASGASGTLYDTCPSRGHAASRRIAYIAGPLALSPPRPDRAGTRRRSGQVCARIRCRGRAGASAALDRQLAALLWY